MTALPPLPLAQQALAWILYALGHAENATTSAGVSAGTLKSAKLGKPIPRTWHDLLAGVFNAIRSTPDPQQLETISAKLRAWDDLVSTLPPATTLTVAERAHAPLMIATRELGVRLGALAALAAITTATPIDNWRFLLEPFEDRFFGNVIRRLFERRLPAAKTIEQRKALLDNARAIDRNIPDWRTIERWLAGRVDVPNAKHLESLAKLFGEDTEILLRAARLACALRKDLRVWIGVENANDWCDALAMVGHTTAAVTSDPTQIAELLRWLQIAAPPGVLSAAADRIEADRTTDDPHARWALATTVLAPHPLLTSYVCRLHGAAVPHVELARFCTCEWLARILMHAVAENDTLDLLRPDCLATSLLVSAATQATARRWLATSMRFVVPADEAQDDPDPMTVVAELLGLQASDVFSRLITDRDRLTYEVLQPSIEEILPDEVVAQSRTFSLARARRLAEAGEIDPTLAWIDRANCADATASDAERELVIDIIAALAHALVEKIVSFGRELRPIPEGRDRDELRVALADTISIVDRLIGGILQRGTEPYPLVSPLHSLVAAASVAIRVHHLRVELLGPLADEVAHGAAAIIDRIEAALLHASTHGRAWALLALWRATRGDRSANAAEKNANHYGAGDFLEREFARYLRDRGLSEDAGL